MRRLLRPALVLAAGAGMLFFAFDLDGERRRRARSGSRRVLAGAGERLRRLWSREAAVDRALTVEVCERLERLTERAGAVRASSEHGCIVLTGDVLTVDRGRLVREIADIPGVDSVIDLMTEHAKVDTPLLEPWSRPQPSRPAMPPRGAWGRGARVIALGAGLGLFASGLRLGRKSGIAAAFVGALLLARALVETARHPRMRAFLTPPAPAPSREPLPLTAG